MRCRCWRPLLAALGLIQSALGVNLRAPNAAASLRLALGGLPLAALAARAEGLGHGRRHRVGRSAAAAKRGALNLAVSAGANLAAAARLAVMMRLTASASGLLAPPGSCGACVLALPSANAAGRVA